MKTIHFGVWTPSSACWEDILKAWKKIESLGFDSAWLADHFINPYQPRSPWFETWSLLAGLATETSTIQIGTMVTNIIYRNPAVLARQAMTVDHISHGRLNFGIGAGSSRDPSHPMTGVPRWRVKERVERFKEIVEILDAMLRNEETTYEGKYYQIEQSILLPRPLQKPRLKITIAALGEKTLKIAAQFGDSWNSLPHGTSSSEEAVEMTRKRNELISLHAEKFGRDPKGIVRSLGMGWTSDKPYDSMGAFYDYVGKYVEAGINEFILGYLPSKWDFDIPFQIIKDEDLLERIALEAIPNIRH